MGKCKHNIFAASESPINADDIFLARCRVERSLLWEITESLAIVGNDLRVGNQLLYSNSKMKNKTNRLQPCPH